MLYWNPKRCYRLFTSEERAVVITEISPSYFPKLLRFINTVLNILLPLYLYIHLQLSWFELAIAFIVFDIALICFEQFIVITIPWAISKIPLPFVARLHHNAFKRRLHRAKDKLDLYRKTYCVNCSDQFGSYGRCFGCSKAKQLEKRISSLEDIVEATGARVCALNDKKASVPAQPVTAPVEPAIASQTDKSLAQYFDNLSERCKALINEHRFDFIIPLRKSCDSMTRILRNNPSGDRCVSGKLCQKLDTIMELFESMSRHSADERATYIESVKEATRHLNDELQQCALNASKASSAPQSPEELLAQLQTEKEITNV